MEPNEPRPGPQPPPWQRWIQRLGRPLAERLVRRALALERSGDTARAGSLWRRAAALGHAQARHRYGMGLLEGAGQPRDVDRGLAHLHRAAADGHVGAMRALATLYQDGRAVAADPAAAVRWLVQAAQRNDPGACSALGLLIESGRGVERHPAQAMAWQLRAARLGDTEGRYHLARHFLFGIGTTADPASARAWLGMAARAGHGPSQYLLGQFDAAPDRVAQDREPAARSPTPFCRALCYFAFHLLPHWLFEAHRPEAPVTHSDVQARVPMLWSEAWQLHGAAPVFDERERPPPLCREEGGWIVIEPAQSTLPPEPTCLLIDLSAFPARMHLVEVFQVRDRRGLLSCIDPPDAHGVMGLLPDRSAAAVTAHYPAGARLTYRNFRPALEPPEGLAMIRHLALYAQVTADLRRARAALRP